MQDGWTDLARRIKSRLGALPADKRTKENMIAAFEEADFEKMEEIRGRCNTLVEDPATAENLKAWYGHFTSVHAFTMNTCKRLTSHQQPLLIPTVKVSTPLQNAACALATLSTSLIVLTTRRASKLALS